MQVKILLGTSEDADVVVMPSGERFAWATWLKLVEQCAVTVRGFLQAETRADEMFRNANAAKKFLHECGVETSAQLADLEKHLPQLKAPSDPSNYRRCAVCGSHIWGKQSILDGIGSGCRREMHKPVMRAMRKLAVAR